MLRALLLPLCLAFNAQTDTKAWQPVKPPPPTAFSWSGPSGAKSKTSKGAPVSFQIRTTIIIRGSSTRSLDPPEDKTDPGKEDSSSSAEKTPEPRIDQPDPGYHTLPERGVDPGYHELPWHLDQLISLLIATQSAPEAECGPVPPKGWNEAENSGSLSWQQGTLVSAVGKALDLVLDRNDVRSASLNGTPLIVVRTRRGQTALKTNRRLYEGTFELKIESSNSENFSLQIGDRQRTSENSRIAVCLAQKAPLTFRPSFSSSAISCVVRPELKQNLEKQAVALMRRNSSQRTCPAPKRATALKYQANLFSFLGLF